MKFRTDINGLRAYAVLFVVLFHFGIYPFNGGFVGVDIFFVISGYLMTRIIVEGLNAGRFSIWKFYFARCKRIIPPLLLVCLMLLLLGYFFVPPAEYATLSKHAFASMAFISNMIYYKEAGYFDTGSSYKWLLHTWSLSVEWQFYLVLPIFLMLVATFFKGKYKPALIVCFLLSFLLGLFLSVTKPSLSYFFFGSRAWEMIAGGLAYTYNVKNVSVSVRKIVTYSGVFILTLSSIFINEHVAWPGMLTLIPVVTTAIIIAVGGDGWIVNNKIAQKIGAWSYSIYLYHWPVLVAAGMFVFNKNIILSLGLTALSIIFGWLSYSIIENKNGKLFTSFSNPKLLFSTAIALGLVSLVIFKAGGFPSHAPENVNYISSFYNDSNHSAKKCFVMDGSVSPECKFGPIKDDDKIDLVVIGDSHAYAILSSVTTSNPNASVVFIAQSSCPAVPGIIRVGRPECGVFMKRAFESAKNKYKNASVLVINRFSQYLYGENGSSGDATEFIFNGKKGGISDFSSQFYDGIKSLGDKRKVFILTPVPDYPYDVLFTMSRKAMLRENTDIKESIESYKKRSADINQQLATIVMKSKNVEILDAAQYLCDSKECYGSKNGIPLYRDSNHLSETGNKILMPLFEKMWRIIN
ncbi:acyltransferase family protein [Klebsiella pneumoniae]|uniref:acyltransferase family protein n=1 Tax=Klebsiella pneumoniae TaxID=573 RepID=UPI0007D6DE5C|nr:acyltransferase family protein [Klebsiella pneumoniae]MCP6743822.1 acyltransferase [Klebsiella pneumoniae]